MANQEIAVLLHGHGAELGNFRFFADDTAAELKRLQKFASEDIVVNQTLDRASFVAALSGVPAGRKIKELHIYSHSIGGSHIEVQRQGKWITSDRYKAQTGRWPGAPRTLRLNPDRGSYGRFDPSGTP